MTRVKSMNQPELVGKLWNIKIRASISYIFRSLAKGEGKKFRVERGLARVGEAVFEMEESWSIFIELPGK